MISRKCHYSYLFISLSVNFDSGFIAMSEFVYICFYCCHGAVFSFYSL